MRRIFDNIYWLVAWAAGLCLFSIMALVAAQIAARLLDGFLHLLHLPRTGFVILSLAEICGYLLASASFLALAPAMKAGAHIRVTMALSALGEKARKFAELAMLAAATLFAAYVLYCLAAMTLDSWRFNEISTGLVPVPLAWPQAAMTLGIAIFTLAALDEFFITLARGQPGFRAAEDAITLGKEG